MDIGEDKLSVIDNEDDDASFLKNELSSINFLVVVFEKKFSDIMVDFDCGLEKLALIIVTWSMQAIVSNIIIIDKSILISVTVSHFLTSFFFITFSCFLLGIS
jgi:hypothetical protein